MIDIDERCGKRFKNRKNFPENGRLRALRREQDMLFKGPKWGKYLRTALQGNWIPEWMWQKPTRVVTQFISHRLVRN